MELYVLFTPNKSDFSLHVKKGNTHTRARTRTHAYMHARMHARTIRISTAAVVNGRKVTLDISRIEER